MYRSIFSDDIFDLFLLSGIVTVVTTRVFLFFTGYPQIGSGSGLHIAHVLFGGLLMMAALVILFTFIPTGRLMYVTAILGGAGFGLFIDEVGKFVTQDVNYFFKPAFVIMYVVFVCIFAIHRLVKRHPVTPAEYLMNSIEMLKDSAMRQIDLHRQQQALNLLIQCDELAPLAPLLNSYFSSITPQPPILSRRQKLMSILHENAERTWFHRLLVIFFVVEALGLIFYAGASSLNDGFVNNVETVIIATSAARALLIFYGVIILSRMPKRTYTLFWYATILSLTIVQLFRLYEDPLYAFIWLLVDIFLLVSLRFLINLENRKLIAGFFA